ncbi:MAG: cell wall hydrolase [Holosporales bacterium]|jgi:spore germination cell wall hydrolase CwlJ-like protein|nr:cell wall hydrolase [Holosporales bacterium]
MTERSIEIMAKTIYGEARGEYKKPNCGVRSLIAIGNVIMNRHNASGKSVENVCLKRNQFSCWNPKDPNKKLIENSSTADPIFVLCYVLSKKLIESEIGDITNGANHYYSKSVKIPPYWTAGHMPVFEIGNHIFFKI